MAVTALGGGGFRVTGEPETTGRAKQSPKKMPARPLKAIAAPTASQPVALSPLPGSEGAPGQPGHTGHDAAAGQTKLGQPGQAGHGGSREE